MRASYPAAEAALDSGISEALQEVLKHAPTPFAVTFGTAHTLIYANPALSRLIGASNGSRGMPITDALPTPSAARLQTLLDRALSTGEVLRDWGVGPLGLRNDYWNCTIRPLCTAAALPAGLIIELHTSATLAPNRALHREVAGRLLISALHEADAADRAHVSLLQSEFLAETERRLDQSLDMNVTRKTVAGIALPILGHWCMVDLIEHDGSFVRLAMIHPDPAKQLLLSELAEHWRPQPGDPFGAPAIRAVATPVVIDRDIDAALEAAAHSPENLRLLREIGIGTLLSVPMMSGDRILGAVTFVSGQPGRTYSSDEIALAEKLATRSADALESARMYEEALLLREQADLATQSGIRFLGNISHDLRTPLNAIVAYSEVIAAEIHGPVTPAQRGDLERIRASHAYLLTLVNELLTFVQKGVPRFNQIVELRAHDAVTHAVALMGNELNRKSLSYQTSATDPDVIALGDVERVNQILVNLLTNAVKFTARGGRIWTHCDADEDQVRISVNDTGIGIAANKLEAIFEPFVQVEAAHPIEGGVGLGLAISRELARTMGGDLTVLSERGKGTCFTLSLPRLQVRTSARS